VAVWDNGTDSWIGIGYGMMVQVVIHLMEMSGGATVSFEVHEGCGRD
jgi:hypothetical protein